MVACQPVSRRNAREFRRVRRRIATSSRPLAEYRWTFYRIRKSPEIISKSLTVACRRRVARAAGQRIADVCVCVCVRVRDMTRMASAAGGLLPRRRERLTVEQLVANSAVRRPIAMAAGRVQVSKGSSAPGSPTAMPMRPTQIDFDIGVDGATQLSTTTVENRSSVMAFTGPRGPQVWATHTH